MVDSSVMNLLMEMNNRLKRMEEEIMEIRLNQKPLLTKDYITELNKTPGTEFDLWINEISVTIEHLKKVIKGKKSDVSIFKQVLKEHYHGAKTQSIRIFDNKENNIFIFKNGKWKLMTEKECKELHRKLYNLFLKLNRENKGNQLGMDESPDYLDRRSKIMKLSKVTPSQFKLGFYSIIREHIAS